MFQKTFQSPDLNITCGKYNLWNMRNRTKLLQERDAWLSLFCVNLIENNFITKITSTFTILGNPPGGHCREYKSWPNFSLRRFSCICRQDLSKNRSSVPEEHCCRAELLLCCLITSINLHCYRYGKSVYFLCYRVPRQNKDFLAIFS